MKLSKIILYKEGLMSNEIVDLRDVLERVQDDRELLMELFDIFVDDYTKKRKILTTLVAENNIGKIKEITHSIKGAAGNISAKAIYSTCIKLEEFAERQEVDTVAQQLPILDEQFEELREYIVQYKKNNK